MERLCDQINGICQDRVPDVRIDVMDQIENPLRQMTIDPWYHVWITFHMMEIQ